MMLRLFSVLCVAGSAASLVACESDDPVAPTPVSGTDAVTGNDSSEPDPDPKDEFRLRVDTEPFGLAIVRDQIDLIAFDTTGIQVGTVPMINDVLSYDPYPLVTHDPLYTPPEDLAWHAVKTAALGEVTDTSIQVKLGLEGDLNATLTTTLAADGRWSFLFELSDGGPPVVFVRLRAKVDKAEGFYGLGELFDDVNHRGKIRAMQTELAPELESFNNEAHVPIPFLIGSTGWGLFVESFLPSSFDVATQADDRVEITVGTGPFSGAGLRFHLFAETAPLDLTAHYYAVTGQPRLPARWALGPWVWRDENDSQQQVIDDANIMRDLDLPCSGIWIDRPYASGVNAFDWDPAKFDDAPAMMAALHGLGYRVALWHTPYVDPDDEDTKTLYEKAKSEGWFPNPTGAATSKWGAPLDFTNPDAFAWWQAQLKKYTGMGIEGFKLDYGEDIAVGLGGIRNEWGFADGTDERTMHSVYQLLYHRAYAELLPDDGGFLLCRAGTYGDQVNGSIIWPGDLDANFAKHGDKVDDYVAVGGMPASMIAGIGLGPSGFAFYGADTGGYRHAPPDKETFIRWFEQTALSTVMQIGTNSNDTAWEFGADKVKDDEIIELYRRYTRLHLRLWPYEWTYAKRILTTGRPIQRPFGLQHPELGDHRWDQYFFGDDLLVAPITEAGVTAREVHLPPGDWLDWWTGKTLEGGRITTVQAPLDTLPLFVRAGAIIPLLRPTIDTMAPTTDPARVDSFASDAGVLHVRIAPGPDHSFELYDGTVISQTTADQVVTVTLMAGSEFDNGFELEILTPDGLVTQSAETGTVEVKLN